MLCNNMLALLIKTSMWGYSFFFFFKKMRAQGALKRKDIWFPNFCVYRSLWESEKIRSPGNEITDGYKLQCGCWEPNLGSLKEQPVLLNAGPPLEPLHFNMCLFVNSFSCMWAHECGARGHLWLSSLEASSTLSSGRSCFVELIE